MRHHQFHPERQDGDNQNSDRHHHHGGFGLHIELGKMGFQQSAQLHHMQMGRIHGHFHPSLPNMEVSGSYDSPPAYARPHYGSRETNYYQHSRHDQGRGYLEFPNPYHQNEQHRSNPGHRSVYTYDGAARANPEQALASARIVAQVARRLGVDPVVAVAAMLVESGGNPRAVGDHGHSFGLFQLNDRGELAEHHLKPNQAFDPATNARVALSYFRRGHTDNPGAMAAAAQRPANRADYARKVNSNMSEAARMVQAMGLA
ncbi:hypothetical protein BH10CYA1_BH10CYA1_49190 [soil metagenome]